MQKRIDVRPGRRAGFLRIVFISLGAMLAFVGIAAPPGAARADQPDQMIETKIEIKIAGTVSEAQRAQIEELMKAFPQQNPRLKLEAEKGEGEEEERESKTGKYHFFALTAAMLAAAVVCTVLAQAWRRARYPINLLANVTTAATFAVLAASGVLLIFGLEGEESGIDTKFWHVIVGTVFVYLIVFHLVNGWRAWLSYGRRLGRSVQGLTRRGSY